MKIKFKVARGRAVMECHNNEATLEEAVALLRNPEVISITVTKITTTQYLKKVGTVKND